LATGKIWLKSPKPSNSRFQANSPSFVTPKDLILAIIGRVSVDGVTYQSAEFTGPTIKDMSIAGRMTLCNMAVEMGAKNAIVEPDEKTREF